MKLLNVLLMTAATTFVVGCSGLSGVGGAAPAKVTWVNQKNIPFKPATADTLPANTANLVFFREADEKSEQTAVNIGINDRYQVSLHGGNYTAIPSCIGNTKISTVITQKKVNDLEVNPNKYQTQPQKNYYFEVFVDDLGNSQATPVTEEVALKKLEGKPLQSHTISRVVQTNCAVPQPKVEQPKVAQPIQLMGIYFFEFDVPTMKRSERQRAVELGQKIINSGRDYQITLSGHADPMGKNRYNQTLSEKRVNDVAQALQSAGLDASRIRMAAFGSTKPIKLSCMQIRQRGSRNRCNVDNRRVEARVTLK